MMGPPYYYYDASSYVEDVSTEFHIHDCMWAGECCACQPARMSFSNPTLPQTPNLNLGTVPVTVGGTGYVTLTANRHEVPHKLQWSERSSSESRTLRTPEDTSSESSPSITPESSPRPPVGAEKPQKVSTKRAASVKSNGSCSYSSSDNKKLRHREVEKNRHRQLQAMVKNLSEKIPGRLDKETQVQTMKRAARYCVYLRDIVESMSHGQHTMSKERLEKFYKSSNDYVELIMAQSGAATTR